MATHDNGPGIFNMTAITFVSQQTDIVLAREYANAMINDSTATAANKTKAQRAVLVSTSPSILAVAMTNFMLSHMGLKVIR